MRRWLIPLLVVAVALGAAAYFLFPRQRYTLRLSEDDLRREIEAVMPFSRTYLLLFDVALDSPRVAFDEEADRIRVTFDAALNVRTRRTAAPSAGVVSVSGGVRYDPERAELFLTDPRVEEATVLRVPAQYEAGVNDALTRILADYFRTRPIHRLDESTLRHVAARLLLREVRVEQRQLVLTFGLQ